MPEIDKEALAKLETNSTVYDMAKPPMKAKEFQKFPHMVYRHPKIAYRTVKHKDAHGNVSETVLPNEHLTKIVANEDDLAASLKSGWKKEPFIAPPLAIEDDSLYGDEPESSTPEVDLNAMNKAQLVEYGATLGLTLDSASTRVELLEQIQAA